MWRGLWLACPGHVHKDPIIDPIREVLNPVSMHAGMSAGADADDGFETKTAPPTSGGPPPGSAPSLGLHTHLDLRLPVPRHPLARCTGTPLIEMLSAVPVPEATRPCSYYPGMNRSETGVWPASPSSHHTSFLSHHTVYAVGSWS